MRKRKLNENQINSTNKIKNYYLSIYSSPDGPPHNLMYVDDDDDIIHIFI